MITLRQIEVIRAIMITGTVKGAAELLGVSSPGISRVMKHTEGQLGIRLFARVHGRYIPTNEAREIFDQISEVYQSIGNLQYAVDSLKKGGNKPISFAAVPSIASHVFPTAIQKLRARYP
ncbi:MAG: LysR family transcriptional regulator, partial [Pseudomonadota bacterium]